MDNQITFDAYLSGDMECFVFKMSKQNYIKLFGIEKYNEKIDNIKQHNIEVKQDYKSNLIEYDEIINYTIDEDPQEFYVYPNELFKNETYNDLHRISLSYEIIKGN